VVTVGYLPAHPLTTPSKYKSHSLDRHISTTWRLSPLLGNYVAPVPAQMRRGPHWFQGSADAIYQNLRGRRVASGRRTLISAGTASVKVKASKAGKRALRRLRRAKLTLRVRIKDGASGSTSTFSKTLTLKR